MNGSLVGVKRRVSVSVDILFFFILAFVYFLMALPLCVGNRESIVNVDIAIYSLCAAGTIQFILTLKSIRRMQGQWFSLYLVFFCFLFVFSYGQFLMWTFGIHYPNELTVSKHVRYIDKETVVAIQVVSLHLLATFHLGALIAAKGYKSYIKNEKKYEAILQWLKIIALPMLFISTAINVYFAFVGFSRAAVVGYSALFDVYLPPLAKYLSYMFIPALYLNLITHDFKERWFYFLTTLFLIYAVPLVIVGDRGSWIYFLGPWLWCYIKFVDKRGNNSNPKTERRKTVMAVVLVLLVFFISSGFVSVRGEGYNSATEDLFSFEDLYTPFVKPIFEMGQSARILGIILQDGLDKTYPYGNTFIADILGMVLPSIKVFFGFPDMYVENWMSTDYLGMVNYGVGFSTFAEAYLNGGIWFSWFYVYIIGYFIAKLTTIKKGDVLTNPIKTYVALGATTLLGPSVRATLDLWLREFFWGVLLVILVAWILASLKRR